MLSSWPCPEIPTDLDSNPDGKYPSDLIELYHSLWINGTRAVGYFGSVVVEVEKLLDWDATLYMATKKIRKQTSLLGANALVGVEFSIDPFSSPPKLIISGTAAELVSMFELL